MYNLDTAAAKFGMEISAERTKIMTNNGTKRHDDIGTEVGYSRPLQITRAIILDEGSRRDVLSRADPTMTALARLTTVWKDKNII